MGPIEADIEPIQPAQLAQEPLEEDLWCSACRVHLADHDGRCVGCLGYVIEGIDPAPAGHDAYHTVDLGTAASDDNRATQANMVDFRAGTHSARGEPSRSSSTVFDWTWRDPDDPVWLEMKRAYAAVFANVLDVLGKRRR